MSNQQLGRNPLDKVPFFPTFLTAIINHLSIKWMRRPNNRAPPTETLHQYPTKGIQITLGTPRGDCCSRSDGPVRLLNGTSRPRKESIGKSDHHKHCRNSVPLSCVLSRLRSCKFKYKFMKTTTSNRNQSRNQKPSHAEGAPKHDWKYQIIYFKLKAYPGSLLRKLSRTRLRRRKVPGWVFLNTASAVSRLISPANLKVKETVN